MPSETLVCIDCGAEFEFTENDQQFYAERDYSKPKRCKPCREKKKLRFEDKDREQAGNQQAQAEETQ